MPPVDKVPEREEHLKLGAYKNQRWLDSGGLQEVPDTHERCDKPTQEG